MWVIHNIRVFPFERIQPGRFPNTLEIVFAFQRFYNDKDTGQNLKNPDYRVAYYFAGGDGTLAIVPAGSGASQRDFLVDGDDVYLRTSYREVGIRGKHGGLKKIVNKRLIWTIRRIEISSEARAEMAAQLSKATWVEEK